MEKKYGFCFVFDTRGKVLVLKRAAFMRARPLEWDLPGGSVETGESVEAAVLREVFEETGIRLNALEGVVSKSVTWKAQSYSFSYYRASSNSSAILLSEEHTHFEWHDPLIAAAMVSYVPHRLAFAGLGFGLHTD